MKKTLCLLVIMMLVSVYAFAQAPATVAKTTETKVVETKATETKVMETKPAEEMVTLKGVIIDNLCAGSQKPEALGEFVKTHTKQCALMPSCAASGYSIFADGKLSKFDKESNMKIEEFLKKADSKLQVVVEAKKSGDELSLVSIMNQ